MNVYQYFDLKVAQEDKADPYNHETDWIYNSLMAYENKIRVMKGHLKLINISYHSELRRKGLRKIQNFVRNKDNCL